MKPIHFRQRGVSLLEALVAMAVMAIGAVAVVGLQSTLRLNGDVAKQRAEAVRLAQEVIESWRGFVSLAATAGMDWSDIATQGATPIVGANATFTREVTVVAFGEADDAPLSKTVQVRVSWNDRANEAQSVTLNSIIAGVHPELSGSIALPMTNLLSARPLGRHPVIPSHAVDQGDGTSRFAPPGGGEVRWIFSNSTGVITKLCSGSSSCSDIRGLLLSGFVRFSTGSSQPTAAQAEAPTSATLPIDVSVDQTLPSNTTVNCFEEFEATAVAYFCLMLVTEDTPRWSGRVRVGGINIVSHIGDDDDDKYKVCRYTNRRANDAVGTGNPKLTNADHPMVFVGVDEKQSMANKNFLVIRAGDDTNPFACPNDDVTTPNVNGSTWYHQPDS